MNYYRCYCPTELIMLPPVMQHPFFARIIDPQGLVSSVKDRWARRHLHWFFSLQGQYKDGSPVTLGCFSCLSEYLDSFCRKAERLWQSHLLTVLGTSWK